MHAAASHLKDQLDSVLVMIFFCDLLDLLLDRSARSIEICSICCLEFAAACSYDGWLLPGCCTRALYLIHAYAQLLLCIRGYPRTAVRV